MSVPVVSTGIRSATIQIIATATLGAVFGFGGLGRYLVDGLSNLSRGGVGMIFTGVILVSCLVLVTDFVLGLIERRLTPTGVRASR